MANYNAYTRTNYFRVTDADRLRKIIDNTYSGDDSLCLFEMTNGDERYYGFGCYDSISGLSPNWESHPNNSDCYEDGYGEDADYNLFEHELQKILHPDDAIIITEVGYEKLRYLTAYSCIITKNGCRIVSLDDVAINKARELLNNEDFETRMEF